MKAPLPAIARGSTWRRLLTRRPRLEPAEWVRATWGGVAVFLGLGTLTALWPNPWFMRMTPVGPWDYFLLGAQALLLGLFLGLRVPGCTLRNGVKHASLGSVFAFLGFGCSLCNQLLLMLFSTTALLAVFEPLRPFLGLLGVGILGWALLRRLRERTRLQ